MEDDLNQLCAKIIDNLDRFNRILSSGRLESKLLTTNLTLPDRLLKLSQQDWAPSSDVRSVDPADRLSVDDIDSLFSKIHSRTTSGSNSGGSGTGGQNRRNPTKKPIPLQQSRILNETNLVGSPSGSLTELSDSGGGKLAGKTFDVEGMVRSLRQSAEALARIENRAIVPIDFERVERYNRRECAKIRDSVRDVELMVQDLEKYVVSEQSSRGGGGERKELVSETLVAKLKDLSETMSQVIFIKNNEYIPDMSKSIALNSFPLAECLDDVNENIRQKKLYQ